MEPTTPMPSVSSQPVVSGGSTKKAKLFVIIAIAVVVVIVLIALLATMLLHKNIKREDVIKAQNNSSDIDAALLDAESAYSEAENVTTVSDLNSKLSDASSKLNNAESTYNTLKKSPVMDDKAVKAKFNAIDQKWAAYTKYIQGNIDDFKGLGTPLLNFETGINDLTKQAPTTTADVGTYLTKFKGLIDTANTQIGSLKPTVDSNQKLLAAFKTFLGSSSTAVQQAQSDLNSGKDSFTIEDDLFKIDDAQTTFDSTISDLEDQANNEQKKLDVSDQFNAFNSALDTLYNKTKN